MQLSKSSPFWPITPNTDPVLWEEWDQWDELSLHSLTFHAFPSKNYATITLST